MDFKRIEVVSDENFKRRVAALLDPRGVFQLVHRSKHGEIIDITEWRNLVTNQGKNYILDAAISTNTPVSPADNWYFMIFSGAFTAAAGSTYAGGGGGTEVTTGYSEATRQEWDNGDASSQSVTNGTAATITANGALSVSGIGVCGSPSGDTDIDTKGDTTAAADGVLLSESAVSKSLADTETLDITYTLSC